MPNYASVRHVRMKPGSAKAIADRVQAEGVAVMRSVVGFRSYHQVYGADDVVTSLTVYDSEAAAKEGNRAVVAWIKENLAEFVVSPIDANEGLVIVSVVA